MRRVVSDNDEVESEIIEQYKKYYTTDKSFKKLFANTGVIDTSTADITEELDVLLKRKNEVVQQAFWDALWESSERVLKTRTISEYREYHNLQQQLVNKDKEIADLKVTIEKINNVLFD